MEFYCTSYFCCDISKVDFKLVLLLVLLPLQIFEGIISKNVSNLLLFQNRHSLICSEVFQKFFSEINQTCNFNFHFHSLGPFGRNRKRKMSSVAVVALWSYSWKMLWKCYLACQLSTFHVMKSYPCFWNWYSWNIMLCYSKICVSAFSHWNAQCCQIFFPQIGNF